VGLSGLGDFRGGDCNIQVLARLAATPWGSSSSCAAWRTLMGSTLCRERWWPHHLASLTARPAYASRRSAPFVEERFCQSNGLLDCKVSGSGRSKAEWRDGLSDWEIRVQYRESGAGSKLGIESQHHHRNRPTPRLTGRFLVRGSQPRAGRQSQGYWVMFRGLGITPSADRWIGSVFAGLPQQTRTGFLKDRQVVVAPRTASVDAWHTLDV